MTKLIIQIPCFNEEQTLPITLADLPREVPGVDTVEWLVIDDGSSDRTAEIAREHGVDHVVRLPRHQGLSAAFMHGLHTAVMLGANVIVNTDADNQYRAADIPDLIRPILRKEAEIVVGARPITKMEHFSTFKKFLQRLGSWAVRIVSDTDIPDAPSGFRAISREAAMRLHVFNDYSYTLETIIQAGRKGMAITWIPIHTNRDLRPSRLHESLFGYLRRQLLTVIRIFMTYRPLSFFAIPGLAAFLAGLAISIRFLFFYLSGDGSGHVQSLILSALLLGIGFFLCIIGLLADLISVNRKLLEEIDWHVKRSQNNSYNDERRV